ncbi:hypothetical protein FDF69_20230 [Clostridium sporogenes]|uniref:hypothetical protein n=1 Tax=Clostridium sporogenes TaxID=1509 RepID=UPI0013CF7628|nr:hypothetical protein [Clostridium sporogenes]NFF69419.1 hypothetical protein [Clostridium sporogenes]NFG00694.1 hypothetical protein [Clostridium sporogenes]NFG08260.1 hypothetical protein [Clostridium sporogenes]NFG53392.1 hypothetical protein [Clostridium sporogenes]NFP86220.1 hypothetical protein [Clostridium sporogenes]
MRLGKIKINQKDIREMITGERNNMFNETRLFAKVIPLQIQEDFLTCINTYVCYSRLFEDVPEGGEIPLYDVTIDFTNKLRVERV